MSRRSECLPTSFFGFAGGRHGQGHGLKLARGILDKGYGDRHHDSSPEALDGGRPRGELGKWGGGERNCEIQGHSRCESPSCSQIASAVVLETSYLLSLRALSSTSVSPPGSL